MNGLFNLFLHDKYDTEGKIAITKYFRQLNIEIKESPNGRYGVDLSARIGGKEYFFDAEVRSEWTRGKFPYMYY